MKNISGKLNKVKKLGFFALTLGLVAIFGGTPNTNIKTTVNVKELSLLTGNQISKVTDEELADWIIKGKADFRLLDIRPSKEYNEYHIPVAENFSSVDLYKANFLPTEKIVICGSDGVQTAQGWFILKSKNYKAVYILDGGMQEWNNKILFPSIPDNLSADKIEQYNKIKEVSRFFGGSPQENSNIVEAKITTPKIEMPAFTTGQTKKKSKREGC